MCQETLLIDQLKPMHKKFVLNNRSPKIKTFYFNWLIDEYYEGELEDIDIGAKFKALKLTWMKRLCDDKNHP